MVKTNGVNGPWSTCSTLSFCAFFFSFSFIKWYCCSDLLRYRQALGSNTLKSKNACCSLSQKPRARSLSLASLDLFSVQLLRSFLLNGTSFGCIPVSLHNSEYFCCKVSYIVVSNSYKVPFLGTYNMLYIKFTSTWTYCW